MPAHAKINFDFSNVTVAEAAPEEIKSTRQRSSKYAEHPMTAAIIESYNDEKPRKLEKIPNNAVPAVIRELRGVAKYNEVGIRIKVTPNGKSAQDVVFMAKELRGSSADDELEVAEDSAE